MLRGVPVAAARKEDAFHTLNKPISRTKSRLAGHDYARVLILWWQVERFHGKLSHSRRGPSVVRNVVAQMRSQFHLLVGTPWSTGCGFGHCGNILTGMCAGKGSTADAARSMAYARPRGPSHAAKRDKLRA
jgi:hypothetical protein